MAEHCVECGISKSADSRPTYWRRGLCPKCYQKLLRDSGRLGARGGKRKSPRVGRRAASQQDPDAPEMSGISSEERQVLREAFETALKVICAQDEQNRNLIDALLELDQRLKMIEGRIGTVEQHASIKPPKVARRKGISQLTRFAEQLSRALEAGPDVPFDLGVVKLRDVLQTVFCSL
jgi:hypothetical protein